MPPQRAERRSQTNAKGHLLLPLLLQHSQATTS